MAEETVLIRFKGEDEASGTARDVQRSVDDLSGSAGKVGGAFSGMGSIMTGVLQGIGQGIAGLAADLGGKALGAVTDFVSGGIAEATAWNSVFAQTEAVMNSTGQAAGYTALELADLAQGMSATAGLSIFSDDAILGATNVLATFTKIEGRNFGLATQSILDMSQALGQDLNSAAMQVGKALNDPIAGVSALGRAGVQFTDEQKAMIDAMVQTGDVAGAQAIILGELNTQFGGSAAAAVDTYAGQQVVLSEKFADVKQQLGESLMPVLMQFGAFMADTVVPIIASAVDGISSWVTATSEAGTVSEVFDTIRGAIAAVPGVVASLQPVLAAAAEWLQPLTDAVVTFGGIVIPIITAAGAAIAEYLASPTVQGYVETITTMLGAFATMVRDVVVLALQAAGVAWQVMAQVFSAAWPSIQTVLDSLYSLASIVGNFLTGVFTSISQLAKGDFAGAFTTMETTVKTALEKLWGWFEKLQTNLGSFFSTIKDKALGLGRQIAQGIADGVAEGAQWVADAITRAVTAAWNAATGWLTGQSGGSGSGGDDQNGDGAQGRSAAVYNTYNFSASYANTQSESSLVADARAMMTAMGAGI